MISQGEMTRLVEEHSLQFSLPKNLFDASAKSDPRMGNNFTKTRGLLLFHHLHPSIHSHPGEDGLQVRATNPCRSRGQGIKECQGQ
jgi:hypothetical protein